MRENHCGVADLAECRRLSLGDTNESAAAEDNKPSSDIADCFLRLANLPTFPLDRLSRYEHVLWRQARQIGFTLEALRRRRQPRRSTFPFSFGLNGPSGFVARVSGDDSRENAENEAQLRQRALGSKKASAKRHEKKRSDGGIAVRRCRSQCRNNRVTMRR